MSRSGRPSQIYVRTTPGNPAVTTQVDSLLGAQASPEDPGYVTVSQPSAALTAQADAKGALDTLFLGLGAVALLVGAIGVANIMVISVLERRSEIGLRRALGATKGQIRSQFLAEAILLALAGGSTGVAIGAAATAGYAPASIGPPSSRFRPGPAAWPRPSSSAPSPASCPLSAPRACHPRRLCGASDVSAWPAPFTQPLRRPQ
jgi:ABC-type antimicrobial peptide transport system permease subunit